MKWSQGVAWMAAGLVMAVGGGAGASDAVEESRTIAWELTEHSEPSVRSAAMLTLGRIGTADQRNMLTSGKASGQEQERIAAGMALIFAGDRDATSFVARQIREASNTYEQLQNASAVLSQGQTISLIEAILENATPADRRDVFRFLSGQTGALYTMLADQLVSNEEQVREAARQALVHTARHATLDVVTILVSQADPEVRGQVLAITAALSYRDDLRAELIKILQSLLQDRDSSIQVGAARQLVALGESAGTDVLVHKLAAVDAEERVEIARFLIEYDIEADIHALRPLIDDLEADEEAATRQKERELLYELAATSGDEALFEDLRQKFNGDIFEDRLVAVRSLGRMGRHQALALLSRGLFEGQSVMRRQSARGLGHLGHPDALSSLRRAVSSDRDKEVRLEAIRAMGRIRDKQSVQALRFLVTDSDRDVKAAVIDALDSIGLPETTPALEVLMRDRDLEIQWRAFLALLRSNPDVVQSHFSSALRNPPQTFAQDFNAFGLSTAIRDDLYTRLLNHAGSRVRQTAAEHVNAHRDALLPLARELVLSEGLRPEVRRNLIVVLISEDNAEDYPRFDRVMRTFPTSPAGQLAAWRLASSNSAQFEASFRRFLTGDDALMKAIAAFATSHLE